MRRLSGRSKQLLLSRTADLTGQRVQLVETTQDAIDQWDWTTRSSPIFPFDGPEPPDLRSRSAAYLYFIGPLDPGLLDVEVASFATHGTFNLVLMLRKAGKQNSAVEAFLRKRRVPWERWEVSSSLIRDVTFSKPIAVPPLRIKRAKVSQGLMPAEEENCTLQAAAIAKASQYFPSVAQDLKTFSEAFRHKLENAAGESEISKQSWLVNVNAHLSRYTSQTFSGVSPIASTECHFWSHSLLGVGTSTQALVNIRKFAQRAVAPSDWIDSLDQLERLPLSPNWKRILARGPHDPQDWADLEDCVKQATQTKAGNMRVQAPEERLPLIVCFSGRDGFRSTPFSLTAPLEVISSSDAYGWTPMTLTHEICHVWMSAIVDTLFPVGLDDGSEKRLYELLRNDRAPSNVLDDVRVAIYFCFSLLLRESLDIPDHEEEIPAKHGRTPREVIEEFAPQVNELLTHIMDYQFFYEQNSERYIRSLWSSWDVIPNIKERLEGYLVRSACALLSGKISHAKPLPETLNQLKSLLTELHREMPRANYLAEALQILTRDRTFIEKRLQKRRNLVRIAKTIFTNQGLAARLAREHQRPGGPYNGMQVLSFDTMQILNPFKFVGQHSVHRTGDRAKSLWILSKIAFMQDPDATFA